MKKILLVMSLIAVLFLAGCSKKNNVNNSGDVINNPGNQTQGSGNELIEDLKSDSEQEKYKLSDSYCVSGEHLYAKDRLFEFVDRREEDRKDIYEYNKTIESDGTNIDLNVIYKLSSTDPYTNPDNIAYDLRINDEKIEFDSMADVGNDDMWLIDLDEADQYKEIVIERVYGLYSQIRIYRLTKDGIKLLFAVDNDWNELLKVKNKWIFTQYFGISDGILMGYYLYEDGEFKYVDRLATGEKITDENGMFPNDFQKMKFSVNGETATGEYKGIHFSGVFNILSRNARGGYNIRLTEDCYSEDEERKKIFPAGTVLEDVTLSVSW